MSATSVGFLSAVRELLRLKGIKESIERGQASPEEERDYRESREGAWATLRHYAAMPERLLVPSMAERCVAWVRGALGPSILLDRKERAMRVLEEAMELAQCEGVDIAECGRLSVRVFSRPVGRHSQEAAGVLFTLVVYARVCGFDLDEALLREVERVEDPELIQKIRSKHLEKVRQGVGIPFDGRQQESGR